MRGAAHYQWKGGISKINASIRQMTENRKWMDAVKARDGQCARCGETQKLEAHHKIGLAELIERIGITSRDDARHHAAVLWDLDNGITLCQTCHYDVHGRMRHAD
jgi:5-methylcytosine-specific restriction endonuclease McrA